MIPPDLLALLRCPRSGQTLELADAAVLAQVNGRVPLAEPPITAALVTADKRLAYPVREDIPVLLAEEAITV